MPTGWALDRMTIAVRLLILAILLAGSLAMAPGEAAAQASDSPSIPVTETDLARISDAELRALILERLDEPAAAAPTFNPAITAYRLQASFGRVRQRLGEILGTYDELPAAFATAGAALSGNREAGDLNRFFLVFGVALLVGWLGERLIGRRPAPADGVAGSTVPTLRRKIEYFIVAFVGRLLSLLLFALIAVVVFHVAHDTDPRDRTAFTFYLSAVVIIRLVAAVSRAYLGLDRPDMRLSAFQDDEARRIYRIVLVTVGLGAFGFFTCALFGTLGVHGDVHLLMLLAVGMVMAGGLAILFIRNRAALARDLAGPETASRYRRRFARAYPWAMAVGTMLIWGGLVVMSLLGATPLFGVGLATISLLILWPSLDAAAVREGARCALESDEVTRTILRVLRIGLAVGTLFLLSVLWRIDLIGQDGGLGAGIARSLLEIGTVVLIAYAGWEALRIWINRKIAAEDAARADEGVDLSETEIGGTGMSRMRTLLPLFKRAGQITIAVIAFMIGLSALGVDIGPVLAGAGVVGIAIGFGSQTLVRDVVSGAFFLMDDALRLGEYIDLGTVRGSVEKIGTRSLQLRHHRGALNTVPFGEIQTLTNYSRDWAIMKLKFRVPFDTDIEKTRKIVKNVGLELLEHPDVGKDFIQPFKSQGVVEVDDYGLVISTKFMCKPGKQFLIRRFAYAAVKKAFADHGIQFARPEVRVSMSDVKRADMEEDTSLALGAAALTKISQPPKPEPAAGA